MPATKVSNLESLFEEETTGDMFESEAERVRVCPGMVGGGEHVFQQQSNGVTPSDHESRDVMHSDLTSRGNLESTWIIQTDYESNSVTCSDVKELHEQEIESGDVGLTDETAGQQTITTTGPGTVTPDDTAATESSMTLVAENGGICQLETADDEIADIMNDQNIDSDQTSTETGDTQLKIPPQSQVSTITEDSQVSEDSEAKSTCNAEHSFSELQHTHSPHVDARVSEKSSADSGVLSATTTLTRDSTSVLSDQIESKGSDLQSKQSFIATLDRQSEDATAGGCGISPLMPGRSISTPAYPHMQQEINGFDRDHEDAAASNVLVPPQSRVPRSHSMDSKLRVSATNASPLGFDRYQHMRSGGFRGSSEDFLAR